MSNSTLTPFLASAPLCLGLAAVGALVSRIVGNRAAAKKAVARASSTVTALNTKQRVHPFGNGKGSRAENGKSLGWLLGGKGANLAEMAALGMPVPPGFTMTTEVCEEYHSDGAKLSEEVWNEALTVGVRHIEEALGKRLGDASAPLLLSVRSGAAISMPGMMDTVLNLGLNDTVVKAFAEQTQNARFVYDSYRRFLDMFGDVVLGIPHAKFEEKLSALREARGVSSDVDLKAADLEELCAQYKEVYVAMGHVFPEDPLEQLRLSVGAVFNSWKSERAIKYMEINEIKGLKGTAVNVQAMVFGNLGNTSGTGVLFTRNPNNGSPGLYGEYLINAQGEDVVAGIRTPKPIAELAKDQPAVYEELLNTCANLEQKFGDMQDVEFTVQEQKLYMLQTRAGKRTGNAAVKIAVDLVKEGLATTEKALGMVTPDHLDQLLHPQFEDVSAAGYKASVVGSGLPASPGAAVGVAVFSSEKAEELAAEKKKCILVRDETSPEDVGGMNAALGMLTARGGMTSHAAVVARGWGKPCVVGCSELVVGTNTATLGNASIKEGDMISLNGSTGEILLGAQPLKEADLSGPLDEFMGWADEKRKLKVMANADTPEDATNARRLGAQGIGLVRTEHMFFEEGRLAQVRKMILTQDEARHEALEALLPSQRSDFEGIFKAMDGLSVTVRLLDPPLHEFLPCQEECDIEMAEALGVDQAELADAVERCREQNPMLGLRGCRLGVSSPEIIRMQARAIFEAAVALKKEGFDPRPEVMVPLVGTLAEFKNQEKVVRETAEAVFASVADEHRIPVIVGTMIETPRAALMADEIASAAQFFSFGTNDLTQMTFGYSRDDAGAFLPTYLGRGILPHDPFQVFDTEGVGQLVSIATQKGRKVSEGLKVGICGEHGGEPNSVAFFHKEKLSYVSCSPFRVPIARLAAAQAAVKDQA